MKDCKSFEAYEKLVIEILLKRDEKGIKDILWYLSYDPVETLKDLEFESDEESLKNLAKGIRRKILYEYKKKHTDFYFADEITRLDNYGVELKIDDPIIRDTIIERCEKVSEDPDILRRCIVNFCTRKLSIDYDERREKAFNIIGFNLSEKKFIEENFDTYCIGELLKAMQNKKYPLQKQKNVFESEIVLDKYGEKELYALGLIKNKDKILQFFETMKNIDKDEIISSLISGEDKTSMPIVDLSLELRKNGIDPSDIFTKQTEVLKLYDTIDEL